MKNNYTEQLGALLRATSWNQSELAKNIGVTRAALNRWINKRSAPRESTKKKIYSLYKEKAGILPLPSDILKKILSEINKEKRRHKNIKKTTKESRQLREDLLLELTYNSNAIEGSTLTKKETESIIFDHAHIPDKSYVEHLEATNHAVALDAIFDGEFSGPVSEGAIKKLHEIVLQGISPDAGKYSKHHRAIRGINLRLPSPEDIQEEMDYFLRRINRPKGNKVAHIASMHSDFEAIHPFGDGNGRVGRLIMIIQLLNAGYAPCVIENKRKAEYYEVLEYAQRKSESHLIKFIVETIHKGYQIIRKHKK